MSGVDDYDSETDKNKDKLPGAATSVVKKESSKQSLGKNKQENEDDKAGQDKDKKSELTRLKSVD